MSARAVLLALLAAAVTASPALAALGGEVTAGAGVARQLQAGSATCATLSDSDFEHLGEYAMDRWVGSRSTHAAMNQRMAAVMGSGAADRMHQLMGRRYAGCGGGGAATMMGGAGVGWMRDGSWRHMSGAQWMAVERSWMGTSMMRGGDHHVSTAGIVAIVIGALALGAGIALLVARSRRHGGAAAPLG